jgi:hypothetical protein
MTPNQKRNVAPSRTGGNVSIKASVVLILFILTTFLFSCTAVTPANTGNISLGKSWSDICPALTTPELIIDYLRTAHFKYRAERPGAYNHTQTPDETVRLKSGDCEDFAALIADALISHGYDAKIISVEAKRPTGLLIHAVAIYRDPATNKWHYIHGYTFKGLGIAVSEGFSTQQEVARTIAEKMGGTLFQYFVMSPDAFRKTYDALVNR